ncbi:MAG: type II toxin-antitoxin system RelE/ParE family toxin [Bryobacterales bacterium]|nr:type II toxin-antitoxin system RelE/ParE family toxin [Bryobacterales bacterium]
MRSIVVSPSAQCDLQDILIRSEADFGYEAMLRYTALLTQALRDIGGDPEIPGSQARKDLRKDIRVYHLRFSRARSGRGTVHRPRRFIVYRHGSEEEIYILQVLHDSRDLRRHLPDDEV